MAKKKHGNFEIKISDEGDLIEVLSQGQRIGSFELDFRDDEHTGDHWYHITSMDLGAAKGQGVGEACLRFHKEEFGSPITAAENTGEKYEDGSHLTGDGAGFVAKMREKGLIEKGSMDHSPEDEELYSADEEE